MNLALAVVTAASIAMGACSNMNPHYDPSKFHHRPNGFQNRYLSLDKSEGFWKWQIERLRHPPPEIPPESLPAVEPEREFLARNRTLPTLTWIGHSTLLLQLDGLNILTDPVFGERASPVSFLGPKRHQRPGIALADLPHIDAVLISHNHYDHLELAAVKMLQQQPGGPPRFYVPLCLEQWFAKNVPGAALEGPERNVFWLDWDQSAILQGRSAPLQLHFLALQHWSARTPWDRNRTLWGSWAVLHPQLRFWFGGDLGYSKDTADIGARFKGFDLAAIPIGGYEPRWFMHKAHVNPEEAVRVMQDIHAARAVGIHWGTFERLTDEPLDQAPRDLQAALRRRGMGADRFFTLQHGQTLRLTPLRKDEAPLEQSERGS